jgi:hypothetical protein
MPIFNKNGFELPFIMEERLVHLTKRERERESYKSGKSKLGGPVHYRLFILLKGKSIYLKNKHFNKSGPFFIQLLCVIDSFFGILHIYY